MAAPFLILKPVLSQHAGSKSARRERGEPLSASSAIASYTVSACRNHAGIASPGPAIGGWVTFTFASASAVDSNARGPRSPSRPARPSRR
jgi:hypothetical protein